MKKANKIDPNSYDDGMLPEYNFKGKKGARGKYYLGSNQAHVVHIQREDGSIIKMHFDTIEKVVILEPDVAAYFPDSESVNNALRTLIALVPNKQIGEKKTSYNAGKRTGKKAAAKK